MAQAVHAFSKEEIMAYLDSELSADRAVALSQHVETCQECQDQVSEFQGLSGQLAAWQVDSSHAEPPNFPMPVTSLKGRLWNRPVLAVCALAAIISLVLVLKPWSHSEGVRQYDRAENSRPEEAVSAESKRMAVRSSSAPLSSSVSLGTPAVPRSTPVQGPLIVRTAQLSLISKDFERIRVEVERISKAHAGYIGQLQLNTTSGESRSLNATLHIPSAQLDAALNEFRQLGHVNGESQEGNDVTQRYVDLDARLANLRTTEQRLQQILKDRTGKLSEILEVEEAVDRTRGEIDTATAEEKVLSNQIAFATLQLSVSEEYKARLDDNSNSLQTRLRNAAVTGYRNGVDTFIGGLALLLSIGPTLLIVLAVGFFPAVWLWRKRDYLRGKT